jgi:hypothetical protein
VFTGSIGTKKYRPSIDDTDPIAVNFETGGEVTVRDEIDKRLAIFRHGCGMLIRRTLFRISHPAGSRLVPLHGA